MARRRKTDDLAEKVKKAIRERELGRAHYSRADAIMNEIAHEVEPGQPIPLAGGKVAELVDRIAGKAVAFCPAVFRRYDLEIREG